MSDLPNCKFILKNAELEDSLFKLAFLSVQGKDPKMTVISWDASQLLSVFRDIYPENNDFLCASDHLIITTCIKKLLLKYDGFRVKGKPQHQIYSDLKEFIKTNIDYLLSIKQKAIDDCTKLESSKYVLEINCPYQQLKSFFYTNNSHLGQSLMCKTDADNIPNPKTLNLSTLEVLHCPHIAINIVFPNFEVFRQNVPLSQYKLVHFTSNYQPNVKQRNQKLKYKTLPGKKDRFYSIFIIEYISQLINMIENSNKITESKKCDMLTIFKAFKTDFSLCTDMIDVDTEYYTPLANQSYVRYMGRKRDEECLLSHSSQIMVGDTKEVRLQEITDPTVMFALKKFKVKYSINKNNKYQFELEEKFLIKNQWLIFSCMICSVQFKGFLATYEMTQHVINEHGTEPDWSCPRCQKSFDATALSVQRWEHSCLK